MRIAGATLVAVVCILLSHAALAQGLLLPQRSGQESGGQGLLSPPAAENSTSLILRDDPGVAAAALLRDRTEKPQTQRLIRLKDLGITDPVVIRMLESEQTYFFPVPPDVPVSNPAVLLKGYWMRPFEGRTSVSLDVAGWPVFDIPIATQEGRIDRAIPVERWKQEDFLRVSLRYAAQLSVDRCADERALGNLFTLDPDTGLTYAFNPLDLHSVRAWWQVLPAKVRIQVPAGSVGEDVYSTLWRIGTAVRESGRSPVFSTDAGRPDGEVPEALMSLPTFSALARPAAGDGGGDAVRRGAELVRDALAGYAPFDVVVDPQGLVVGVNVALDALEAELAQESPGILQAFRRWRAANPPLQLVEDDQANLVVGRSLGQPVLVIRQPDIDVGPALIASHFRPLVNGPAMLASKVFTRPKQAGWLPFSAFGLQLPSQDVFERGQWVAALPSQKFPFASRLSELAIEVVAAPDSSDVAPVASVFLNDVLLTAKAVATDGSVTLLRADVPHYLLQRQNLVRIYVDRQIAGDDCRATRRGYPVQVLPSSRALFESDTDHKDFFSLASGLSIAGKVIIPRSYLAKPADSLSFVVNIASALGVSAETGTLSVLAAGTTIPTESQYVAFDAPPPENIVRKVQAAPRRLVVRGDEATTLLDAQGVEAMGALELVDDENRRGVLVTSIDGLPQLSNENLDIDRGDIAFVDSTGLLLWLNSDRDRDAELYLAEVSPFWDWVERYRWWLIALFAVVAFGVGLVLLRRYLLWRARRQPAK